MTDGAAPHQGQADADGTRKSTSRKSTSRKSTAWKVTIVARWIAALVVAILALLATRHEVCHLTTTNLAGLPATSPLPKTDTTSTCTGVGFPDLTGYFLVIAVLLLPDARSIGIGGFRFERLTSKVEEVSKEVGALSQNLNQTFNIGADALNELRAALRKQKADLDEVRGSLPDDEHTTNQLSLVDDVAKRSDDALTPDILHASITAATLIDEAKRAAKAEVDRGVAVSDADVATAQDAGEVVNRLLAIMEGLTEATDDQPDTDA